MLLARRIYLYLASGLSLAALAIGLLQLLTVLLLQLGEAIGGAAPLVDDPDPTREQLSLGLALVAVGLPVWLLHWFFVERTVRGSGPGATVERASATRALFFTIVLLGALGPWISGAHDLLRQVLGMFFGLPNSSGGGLLGASAIVLVGGSILIFHAAVRIRDMRAVRLERASAWLPRLYLYVASFAGLAIALAGASSLIETLLRLVVGRSPAEVAVAEAAPAWWILPAISSVVQIAVGLTVWTAHWRYSFGVIRSGDHRAASERDSRLRVVYFLAVALASAIAVLFAARASLESALQWVLGIAQSDESVQLVQDLIGPPLSAVPFVAAWWLHRRRLSTEAWRFGGDERAASARRLLVLLGSLVGLAFAVTGTVGLLGILIDVLLGGSRTLIVAENLWRRELSQFAALAAVGAPFWLGNWYVAERRRATHPHEALATARRAFLYLVLSVALIAGLTSLAFVLYRLLRAAMGVSPLDISDLSTPLGALIVMGLLLVFHGVTLRGDLRTRARLISTDAATEQGAPTRAVVQAPVETSSTSVSLVLTGPSGTGIDALITQLRALLPEGYSLAWADPSETGTFGRG